MREQGVIRGMSGAHWALFHCLVFINSQECNYKHSLADLDYQETVNQLEFPHIHSSDNSAI